ncbi:MAG TPA: circadian clock protein KaiC [Vicinamibacterales bacterium]|nr:circadian clock protein KaiC [Vicinamibacterales bacterium]
MNSESEEQPIEKRLTGINGFDHIADGGLPRGRATLVAGTAGSGKTVLAMQFLVEGTKRGENGVFVTFEEPPADLRRNVLGFGWNLAAMEAGRQIAFVDASERPEEERIEAGSYDFGALVARIEGAVRKVGAKRVALDSIGAVFAQFSDSATVRRELHRISAALKQLDVTAIITAERTDDYGPISRHGMEEFVADNVVLMRNVLEDEKRRRTIEILKLRGTNHQKGEYPFSVTSTGIIVIPLSAIELKQKSSTLRITSGNGQLDAMCGGGFFRDSVVLVSGATGAGKTLMVTAFAAGGIEQGERSLTFCFEESREQFFRNAAGWGFDFEQLEQQGRLKVVTDYPEIMPLEDHLIRMKAIIEEFKPNRVAVDSLSALERVAGNRGFREFIISLTAFVKHQEMAGLFTSTTPTLLGGTSVTEAHISTICDSIILLRYVEIYGEMRRGLTVLKMRGSAHDKDIREYIIDGTGMHLGKSFRNISGIIAGNPVQLPVPPAEIERLRQMFDEE